MFGGLRELLELEWLSPSRITLHFADNPGHGNRFHDFDDDIEHEKENSDEDWRKLWAKFNKMNISY